MGREYLDASAWIDDRDFNDAVHLTAKGARAFSPRLATWAVAGGL